MFLVYFLSHRKDSGLFSLLLFFCCIFATKPKYKIYYYEKNDFFVCCYGYVCFNN